MIMKNQGCIWIFVPAIPQQLKCKLQISVESFLKRFSCQSSEALGLKKLAYNQINGALFSFVYCIGCYCSMLKIIKFQVNIIEWDEHIKN